MADLVDNLKTWIGENHRNIAIAIGILYATTKVSSRILDHMKNCKHQQILKKWESAPKDVVILHTLPRGKTVPNLSPFAMKLETYLRMNNIPYEIDFETPYWGPVGKTPWITLNGQHISDSQVILELLNEEYNIKESTYSEEQHAMAIPIRIMMDEYLYWGLALWRYVYSEGKGLSEIFNMPNPAIQTFYKLANPRVQTNSWAQGLGRHSPEQVVKLMKDALESLSAVLGKKKFLLGDEPCEEDCAVFGSLAELLWAAPGSPYEKFIKEDVINLNEYCKRMKSLYWSDWNECVAYNTIGNSIQEIPAKILL